MYTLGMSIRVFSLVLGMFFVAQGTEAAPREKIGAKTEARIDGRLYSQPNRYGKPVSIVGRGLELKVLKYSSSRAWALVETPSKRRGWIPVRSTTLGIRYSPSSLVKRGAAQKAAPAASRGPASDDINLYDLGYDGDEYVDDAEGLAENALQEAEIQANQLGNDNSYPDDATEYSSEELGIARQDSGEQNYDDQGYADDDVGGEAGLIDELNAIDPSAASPMSVDSKKPLRGVRVQNAKAAEPVSDFNLMLGLEYANQINVGATSGFGFGLAGSMPLSPSFSLGIFVGWNRFVEKAQTSEELVTRTAKALHFGPMATLKSDLLGVDLSLGLTRTSTKVAITDNDGVAVNDPLAASFSETAFGFRIRPYFDLPVSPSMALKLYLSYGIDFYGAPEGVDGTSYPQTFGLGAAFVMGF
jgi:hypothetical protein